MIDTLKNIVLLHVWIHSNATTGKPDSVDVFEVNGRMHFQWFVEAMEDNNGPELAEEFYKHLKRLDDSAWFIVRMETETAMGTPEHYAEVLGVIEI